MPQTATISAIRTPPRARGGRAATFPSDIGFTVAVSALAFVVLGYHPYAEDGGIYTAMLAARLDPSLFPHDRLLGTQWVVGQMQWSLFTTIVTTLLRVAHLSLPVGLLLLQAASLIATVWALLHLAQLCFASPVVARYATALVAVCLGLPVAGTSLYLLDPYVTARSLSTPLLLLATAACLRHRLARAAALWLAAFAMHPLMAVWGLLPLLLLVPLRRAKWLLAVLICVGVVVVLGLVWVVAPPAGALTLQIAHTRGYWFLSQWRWYEWLGALLPIVLLALLSFPRKACNVGAAVLARAVCLSALTGCIAALLFAFSEGRTVAVARLQPLRTLHETYAVFLVLAAGSLVIALPPHWRRFVLPPLTVALAATLLLTQRSLYPNSGHFEFPKQKPRNGWEQAFLWCQLHTPNDALFALDAAYTTEPGEDVQGFRAVALRSVLPDRSKDAGVAAVVPSLERAWRIGADAQTGLNRATDVQRRHRLGGLGVDWLVLSADAVTALPCPYRNASAKVCRFR